MEKFIRTVKELIESRGVKQRFVAEQMGISEKKLSDVLHGRKTIDIKVIKMLCKALKVTPNDLFGYDKTV